MKLRRSRFLPSTIPVLALAAAAVLGARPATADPLASEAAAAVRRQLPSLLIDEADLAVSTGTLKLDRTVAAVEAFFPKPLAFPVVASGWLNVVESAEDLGPLFVLADNLLGGSPAVDPAALSWEPPEPVPPSARASLKRLVAAMVAARPFLDRAVDSVSPDDRAAFAGLYDWPADGKPAPEERSSRRLHRRLDGMRGFREADMRTAGGAVLMALDAALAELKDTTYFVMKPVRFPSPAGDIVIGGNGPDIYTPHDIEGAVIVLDFGGRNTWVGPVAFAGPGEMRVVIDLGTSVELRCDPAHAGSAGAALFGIAALAVPNDVGVKRLTTGDWSQGAALGGVAACIVSGRTEAKAGRYAQGAAVHGIGLFSAVGAPQSSYEAAGYAQGVGGLRGIGIFRHDGDDAAVTGGLVSPDPREEQAAESLCQGVGFGPRAYAGGGIGLCSLAGDRVSAQTSYFGQGSGYWHSAGAFRLRGDHGTVQGRRYTLGAGIHAAFGHFECFGDDNRILNWAVGPGYGWDHGVGTSVVAGARTEVQANWSAGAAAVGGRSFGYYAVDDGRFKVPDFGYGQFLRNESAFTVQISTGAGTRIAGLGEFGRAADQPVMRYTGGLVYAASTTFVGDNALNLAPPVWPSVAARAKETEDQAANLRADLARADQAEGADAVAAVADVAGAFSLDKATPREALGRLLSLPADKARFLVDALDPAAFDQTLVLSIAIAARGGALADALYRVKEADRTPLCTGLLRFARPSVSLPLLAGRAGGDDPVWATAAVRALGALMNRDTGEEPGTRATLEAIGAALRKGGSGERAIALLSRVRLIEALGLLSTAAAVGPDERLELLSAGPDDITERLGGPGAGKFMDILGRDAKGSRARVERELKALEKASGTAGKIFERAATSPSPALAEAAVVAAGQAGRGRDAVWIEPLLSHPRGTVRLAAAIALARMGEAGLPALRRAGGAASPGTRALAAFAAGHATTSGAASLLDVALSDHSPVVLMTAVAVLRNPPPALAASVPALKKRAARRLSEATGRDTKFLLNLLR